MKAFQIAVAVALWLCMVNGQFSSEVLPTETYYYNSGDTQTQIYQRPGEIIPGLTVSYLTNAAGGIWQQERVIDSLYYACRNVLPYLSSVVPELDGGSVYWVPICEQVREAAEDLDSYDASGFCDDIIYMVSALVSEDTGERYRRQVDPSMGSDDPLGIIGNLTNIVRDLYGIDINAIINDPSTINTICMNVKEKFLTPSIPDLISQFGTELLSALLPNAAPICQDWDAFLQSVVIDDTSPYYSIIQEGARLASELTGYEDREELCDAILEALDEDSDTRKSFSRSIIDSIFDILEDADKCTPVLTGALDDILDPILGTDMGAPLPFTATDLLYQYTGFLAADEICNAAEMAFTTEVELPSPKPIQLISGTGFTIEFFINAAGGMWQQDRLIDTMSYACSDVLPAVTAMVPSLSIYSSFYRPVCDEIQEAARNLEAFDSTGFCDNITEVITYLVYAGQSVQSDEAFLDESTSSIIFPLLIPILANITKDLYGIDINDTSTICPNVAQFLDQPLSGIITDFGVEVLSEALFQLKPLCEDWDAFLGDLFWIVPNTTIYDLIEDGANVGAQLVGYDSRQDLCQNILTALDAEGEEELKTLSMDIISTVFMILTDADKCSVVANGVIDDIVEPLFSLEAPDGYQFQISDYLIYRYTGYEDIDEICEAVETAFTNVLPLPRPPAGELITGSGLTVSLIINLAGSFWAKDRYIDSMAYACSDILPVLSQTIPELNPFRRYWVPVCRIIDEAVNDPEDFDGSGFCYEFQELITSLFVVDQVDMSYPDGNMQYPQGGWSPDTTPYYWGNTSSGGYNPYPSNSSSGGMPWNNNTYTEETAGFLYSLIQVLNSISNVSGIDINNLTTVCSNQATEFLELSLADSIVNYGSEVISSLLPLAEPICGDWDGFLNTLGVNSSLPYYQVIEDGARIASNLMGYDSRDALCQDLESTLEVEGDEAEEARREFSRNVLEELLSFLTSADTCTSIATDVIDNIIEPLINMFTPGMTIDITDEMIYDFTGFRGVGPMCQAMAKAFAGCRPKHFDFDGCGVCVKPPGNSIQFHFMSRQQDCAGRCPRDDDYGAIENECGRCVLGATGLPVDIGMNECGICGRKADLSCVGCDGGLNSGLVYDNCMVCGGNGTTCKNVTFIHPNLIPSDIDYEITIFGAGFVGSPGCRFRNQENGQSQEVDMEVSDPSRGTCTVSLPAGFYDLLLTFSGSGPLDNSITLQVYDPITISSLAEDEFTLDQESIMITSSAAENSNFQAVADLTPYLLFGNGFPPLAGVISGDSMNELSFTLQAPPTPGQLMVSPSLNGIDALPGAPFTITFFAPSPIVDSLEFSPSGNRLLLAFEDAVRIDDFEDCNSIFLDHESLGDGSRCMLTRNNRVIMIVLDEASIQPGGTLTLLGDVIFSRPEFSRALPETVVTVGSGDVPDVNVVLRGASVISSCGDVDLTARGSTGGASRALTYTWSIESEGSVSNELVTAVTDITTSDLTVDGELLTEEQAYTFTVSTTNFLGGSGTESIVVTRSAEQVPDLVITPRGIDPDGVPVFRRFFLNADVTFYSDCEGAGPEQTEFVWTTDIDSFDESVHGGSANSRTLLVEAFSIPGGSVVTFTVEARRAGASSGPTSSITVSFISSDLVARILGGSERSIGVGSGMFNLVGSQSYDPDQSRDSEQNLEYDWSCEQVTDETPCEYGQDGDTFPAESDSTSSTLTVDASLMTPEKTYQFTLEVSSGSRRASTSVRINALAGDPPSILVSTSSEGPVLSTEPVSLTALAQHSDTTSVIITWTITGLVIDVDYDLNANAQTFTFGPSTVSTTIIDADILQPGQMYIVEATATTADGSGLTALSQLVLDVAGGVSSCQVLLESGDTYTVLDQITFLVDDCVTDEDANPLTYQLLARRNDAGGQRSITPVGQDSRITVTGPPARQNGDGTNTFEIQVCNTHSSCATYTITATVERRQSFNYTNLKEDLVDAQVLRGDYTGAFVNINALIQAQNDQSARRKRAAVTSQQASDQLMILEGAVNNTVLDVSTAATLLDESPSITVSDLSKEDLSRFVRILKTLVSVFLTEMEALPTSTSEVVVSTTMAIEEATNDEEILYMIRSLIMSLTRASLADQTLGDDAIQTMSAGVTSSAILALPQGVFASHDGEGAINVDFGTELAESHGAFWDCESGSCTGVSIQFSQYSNDIDPYSTNDDDRNDRASAILDIVLYDPSTLSKLDVNSLTTPISIHMPISLPKEGRSYECSFWDTTNNQWSTTGVETVMTSDTLVECQTTHLSAFVVLAGEAVPITQPTPGPPGDHPSTERDNTGIIIGCVIGGLVAVVLIIGIILLVSKKKKIESRDNDMGAKLSPASHGKDNVYDFNMHNLDQPL